MKFMGNSATYYAVEDYSQMVNGRVLPWTQSTPETNVWEMWDITTRDLVILNREGFMVAKFNLTTYNPDPNGIGLCTGNYETIKNLILDLR